MQPPRVIPATLIWRWRLAKAQALCLSPRRVYVRPEREHDAALLKHEFTHARQQRLFGLAAWWWFYVVSPAFRFRVELQAYRAQLTLRPWALDAYARSLAENYRLDLTFEEAREALSE